MFVIKNAIRLLCLSIIFFYSAPELLAQSPDEDAVAVGQPGNEDIKFDNADRCIASDSLESLRSSYGSGLRYMSDGPGHGSGQVIHYGKPLDRGPEDSSGQWEFTMGSMF